MTDLNNPLFKIAPSTLNINQPNTQSDGAIKGKLRISGHHEQFDKLHVVLLAEPVQERSYYAGAAGTMNRKPENLLCFSKDSVYPDPNGREVQAITCADCPQGDKGWEKWRETRDRSDAPKCDAYYRTLMLAKEYKLPFQQFIRSKNRKPFETGMKALAKMIMLMRADGIEAFWYDIGFTMSTQKILTNGLPSYIVDISEIAYITPEERREFGPVYAQYTNKSPALADPNPKQTEQTQVVGMRKDLEATLVGDYEPINP
jgi:hypothetical protein